VKRFKKGEAVKFYTDGREYVVAHLPPGAVTAAAGVLAEGRQPFAALLLDKDEVTLVMVAEIFADYAGRLPDHKAEAGWRLITLDEVMGFTELGVLAALSRKLAEAGIPLLAFSAYHRDHLLVPTAKFDRAWEALHQD
jgi:hypothetical protein